MLSAKALKKAEALVQRGIVQAEQAYSGNHRSNQNESPLKTSGKAPSHALGISQDSDGLQAAEEQSPDCWDLGSSSMADTKEQTQPVHKGRGCKACRQNITCSNITVPMWRNTREGVNEAQLESNFAWPNSDFSYSGQQIQGHTPELCLGSLDYY